MPSDSIAGFLDQAKARRVLIPEQVEQLIRQPDIPQSDLNALCEYLEERGALTRFQAGMLRGGRGDDLSFAGYPVLDEIGPCPGGTAYRARHPSLRTPVVLRRYRADALEPADTPAALVQRAQAFSSLHPNLVTLLDAGICHGEAYAAIDQPADADTLDALVREIGPVPAFLAAEYGRQVASALRVVDGPGMWHGDVRPANLLIGPMTAKARDDGTIKRRPAPNAAVKLAELGLVPVRPPAAEAPPPPDAAAYLPPERMDAGACDVRGDLYGLGASLYYLLAGRPPFAGESSEAVLEKVRASEPVALASLRPDLPAEFAHLIHHLLAKNPADRPQHAADVEAALTPFCRPGTIPPPPPSPLPTVVPVPVDVAPVVAVPVEAPPADFEPHPAPAEEWGTSDHGEQFSTSHAEAGPVRKRLTGQQKFRARVLMVLGLCLHLTAVGLFAAWMLGVFTPDPEPTPAPGTSATEKGDKGDKKKVPAKPSRKPKGGDES